MDVIRRCLMILDHAGRVELAVLGVLILLNTIMELATLGVVMPFLAFLNDPSLVQSNPISRYVYELAGVQSTTTFLALVGLALFTFVVFKNIYLYWLTRRQSKFGYLHAARVSQKLFAGYLTAPFQVHLNRNSADMITTVDYSVDAVFSQVVLVFLTFVTDLSVVIAMLAFLLVVEPYLTLTIILVLGVCSLGLALFFRKEIGTLGKEGLEFRVTRMKMLQQALSSIKELKVLGREHFFFDTFRSVRQRHALNQARMATLLQVPRQVIEVIAVGGLLLVVVLILLQGRATSDTVAILGLFAVVAFRTMPVLNRMLSAYNTIIHAQASVLEVSTDLENAAFAGHVSERVLEPLTFNRALELKSVSFAYNNAAWPVVKQVSLRIAPGESVAFVGSSGAGKSTLVDIILGLLAPQQGEVIVDGANIFTDASRWRQIIGYVPQSIALIDDTILNNVAFGVEPAKIDEKRVRVALAQAHLDKFCVSLPEGLHTMLGERGVRLSGGQRQRIGIARALYPDPKVLVLDEATSALDNESEREISLALESVRRQKTLIIIAHRLSTVKSCDRLFVMSDGSITDTGTFSELVERCPEFRDMVRLAELTPTQLQGFP